jgi:hypothetical protein
VTIQDSPPRARRHMPRRFRVGARPGGGQASGRRGEGAARYRKVAVTAGTRVGAARKTGAAGAAGEQGGSPWAGRRSRRLESAQEEPGGGVGDFAEVPGGAGVVEPCPVCSYSNSTRSLPACMIRSRGPQGRPRRSSRAGSVPGIPWPHQLGRRVLDRAACRPSLNYGDGRFVVTIQQRGGLALTSDRPKNYSPCNLSIRQAPW